MHTTSFQTHELDGRGERQYLPALDGIRALALLAVLAYHAAPKLFPGGFIGVEVFFVVSGFIITRSLAKEHAERGRVSLAAFWQRRAMRLVPALLVLLSLLMCYAVTFEPDRVARLRQDALPALAYVTNWYLIFDHQSYFDSFAPPSPLRHLWSLAVEEQFYIVWPVVFASASRWFSRGALISLVFVLAGLSALTMALLYDAGAGASRLYYGTDTRAAGFLIGAALALIMRDLPAVQVPHASLVNAGALIAIALLAALTFSLPSEARITYQGGLLLVAVLSAGLVYAAAAEQETAVSRGLARAPMRWFGVRSYGIYLWHWPLVVLASPELRLPLGGLGLAALQIALAIALAALSYTFIEQPIRQGAFARLFAGRSLSRFAVAAGGSVAFVFVGVSACTTPAEVPDYMRRESLSGFVTATAPSALAPADTVETAATGTPAYSPDLRDRTSCDAVRGTSYRSDSERWWFLANCVTPVPSVTDAGPESARSSAPPVARSAAPTASAQSAPSIAPAPVSASFVTAVGDSVMLGATEALAGALGNVYVDAAVSRQASAGVAVLRSLQSSGQLGGIVVVHLGNNGTLSESHIHEIMSIAGPDRVVVFVTLKVDRPWESGNNTAIWNATSAYPNARVADWNSMSRGRPELFWDDGIHLRPAGATLYASLIASTVR